MVEGGLVVATGGSMVVKDGLADSLMELMGRRVWW